MWQQTYFPLFGSLGLSTLAAALPIFVLLYLLGVKRKPAWSTALTGLAVAAAVARAAVDERLAGVRIIDLEGEIHRAMWQPVYRPVAAA